MTASATDAAMQSFIFWAIQYFTEEHPRMEVINGLTTPEFWNYVSGHMKDKEKLIEGFKQKIKDFEKNQPEILDISLSREYL